MTVNTPTHLHYRTSFDIEPTRTSQNSWGELISEIRRWMSGKTSRDEKVYGGWFYRGNLGNTKKFKPGVGITVASNVGNGTEQAPEYWAAQLEEQCKEHPGIRRWKTDIGVTSLENGRYELSLMVSHCIKSGYIGEEPPIPVPTTPNLITKFLCSPNWHAFSGEEQLSCYPTTLHTGEVPDFINVLEETSRLCPIIYVSRSFYTNEPLIDVHKLAKVLAGNALVCLAESNLLDKETEHFFPQNFRCWNGMVRVYQPKIDFSSSYDHNRHRYFKAYEIEKYTPDGVINMLVRGISRRSIQWKKPKVTSLSDIVSKYRALKIAELSSNKENIKAEEWLEELEALLKENDELRKDKSNLEDENLNLEERIEEKEDALSRTEYEKSELIKAAEKARNSLALLESKIKTISHLSELPKNLFDVIELIEKIHPDNIVFTQQAKKSVKDATWVPVDIAWPCLWSVATTLHSLFFEDSEEQMDIEKIFQERTGFELAMTEGRQTKKDSKLLRQRKIEYEGKELTIEPHVKYGNKKPKLLRVYFCPDNECKKIIVGHCGDHLENYSSQFRK